MNPDTGLIAVILALYADRPGGKHAVVIFPEPVVIFPESGDVDERNRTLHVESNLPGPRSAFGYADGYAAGAGRALARTIHVGWDDPPDEYDWMVDVARRAVAHAAQ